MCILLSFRYIVVATEYLTRFVVAKPITNKDSEIVADFIYNDIICFFGIPRILQHDQGTEFCNKINHYVCDQLNVKEAVSTAYHPQTNGLTERYENSKMKDVIKK